MDHMSEDAKQKLRLAYYLCEDIKNKTAPNDGSYCKPYWDSWSCWNYTRAGHHISIPCPSYIEGFDSRLKAHHYCTDSGIWWTPVNATRPWANYTTCVNLKTIEEHRRELYLHVAGYSVSIFFLIIAILIFTIFRQLRCTRVTIHKHLFTSYILTGIAFIVLYTGVSINPDVLEDNPVWCQMNHVITQYFVLCNFTWMCCEGLYLHTVIVVAFTTGKRLLLLCSIIGWGFPVIPTILYGAIRSTRSLDSGRCWMSSSKLEWIIFGPILLTLIVNVFVMCNVVRVLIVKLRHSNSPHSSRTRKAVRAALILIPLLGLQFALFPVSPDPNTNFALVYRLLSAFVTSFQGFFVALILCFFNSEVIELLRRRWDQRMLMTSSRSQLSRRSTNFGSQIEPPFRRKSQTEMFEFNGHSKTPSRRGSAKDANVANKNGNLPAKAIPVVEEVGLIEKKPSLVRWEYVDIEESLQGGSTEDGAEKFIKVDMHVPPLTSVKEDGDTEKNDPQIKGNVAGEEPNLAERDESASDVKPT